MNTSYSKNDRIINKLSEIEKLLERPELESLKAKDLLQALIEASEYNTVYLDALNYLKGVLISKVELKENENQ